MTPKLRPVRITHEVTSTLDKRSMSLGPYENTAIHAYVLACQAKDVKSVYEMIDENAAGGVREVTLAHALPPNIVQDLEMRGFGVDVTDVRTIGDTHYIDGFVTTVTW